MHNYHSPVSHARQSCCCKSVHGSNGAKPQNIRSKQVYEYQFKLKIKPNLLRNAYELDWIN